MPVAALNLAAKGSFRKPTQGDSFRLTKKNATIRLEESSSLRKIKPGVHRKQLIQGILKRNETLQVIKRYTQMQSVLLITGVILALIGIFLSIIIGELCRYGYIPTPTEEASGLPNPYKTEGHGCVGDSEKVYSFQSAVAFTTLLLAIVVIASGVVSYHQKEGELAYVARYSVQSCNVTSISKTQRAKRWYDLCLVMAFEVFFTVLPHPFPGYARTFEIQAMDRTSIYQFESIIVIFMRIWHLYKYWKHSFFRGYFDRSVYNLGHHRSIVHMFEYREELTNALAIKMIFSVRPVRAMCTIFTILLLTTSYCIRVAESPLNKTHSTYYWNHLWLVIVTMTTVGYGDTVAISHFGRLVSTVIMALGTLLISLMTASATANLAFSLTESRLVATADAERLRGTAALASASYLQYRWRVKSGKIQSNWWQHDHLRRNFWKAVTTFRKAQEEVDGSTLSQHLGETVNRDQLREEYELVTELVEEVRPLAKAQDWLEHGSLGRRHQHTFDYGWSSKSELGPGGRHLEVTQQGAEVEMAGGIQGGMPSLPRAAGDAGMRGNDNAYDSALGHAEARATDRATDVMKDVVYTGRNALWDKETPELKEILNQQHEMRQDMLRLKFDVNRQLTAMQVTLAELLMGIQGLKSDKPVTNSPPHLQHPTANLIPKSKPWPYFRQSPAAIAPCIGLDIGSAAAAAAGGGGVTRSSRSRRPSTASKGAGNKGIQAARSLMSMEQRKLEEIMAHLEHPVVPVHSNARRSSCASTHATQQAFVSQNRRVSLHSAKSISPPAAPARLDAVTMLETLPHMSLSPRGSEHASVGGSDAGASNEDLP